MQSKKYHNIKLLFVLFFCLVFNTVRANEVTDVLNQDVIGITRTTYSDFSEIMVSSHAVYAGQCAGSYESIQLRSSYNNSGLFTTASGGTVKKIVVVWNDHTAASRTLNIYGSSTAYTSATNLYDTETQGSLIGTLTYEEATENVSTLVVEDEYAYIGVRSAASALYLTSISITWEDGEENQNPNYVTAPTITPSSGVYSSAQEVIISADTDASIYFTIDGSEPTVSSPSYINPFIVETTTTVRAIAVQNDNSSVIVESIITIDESLSSLLPANGTWSVSDITVSLGDNIDADYTTDSDAPITYSSSNEDVVIVSEDGIISAVGIGSAVITASQPRTDTYNSSETYLNVSVQPKIKPVDTKDATIITWNPSVQGYTNGQSMDVENFIPLDENVSIKFDKGDTFNTPRYYTSDETVRLYCSNSLTINGKKDILKIEMKVSAYNLAVDSLKCDKGFVDYSNGWTWQGKSQSVKLYVDGTRGHIKIESMTIYYAHGKYSIIYLVDNEVLLQDSIMPDSIVPVVQEPAPIEGYTFSGWGEIPVIMPTHDLTFAGSFIPNIYAVRYIIDGEKYKTDSVTYASKLVLAQVPIREGYTFSGWSEIPDSMPAHDITINGSFIINSYQLVYTVDGEIVQADSMAYASELTPLDEPSKEGYTFSGWSEIPASMPAKDVTVTGSFYINKYKLTYVLDGEILKSDSVAYASNLTPLAEPTKEGYTFSGWSEIPQTMPAVDVTITGSFLINTYLVTYMMDGEVWHTDSVTFGQGIPMPEVPARYGYVFNNWTDMPTNGLMPAHDVTVTAYYSPSEIETDDSKYVYSDEAEGYEYVSTVSEESTEVVIPQEVEGIPVTIIPEGAFADQPQVQVVTWDNPAPVENTYFAAPEEHGNLLVFVTSDTAIVTYEGNVVRNGVAEKVTLYDGRPMTNPKKFKAEHISITKDFSKETIIGSTSGWETIVVPFDVDSITTEDGQLIAPFGSEALTDKHFWLAKMDATDGFLKVSQIRANVPYIISMPNSEGYIEEYRISGKVTFHGTNVEVQPTVNATPNAGPLFGLVPTYQEVAAADNVFVLNDEPYEADGIAWPAGSVFVRSSRAARPFEAYTYANTSNGGHVKGYIPLDEMATGLQQILNAECTMHNAAGAVYDLSGRRIAGSGSLKKGLYIESGQKVLVK